MGVGRGRERPPRAVARPSAAYFTEGEPIGDPATLERLAIDAGLPGDDVREVLRSDRYQEAVRADELAARALGAHGVPFFVVDRSYGVSGAQPTTVFAGLLDRAWAEAANLSR